ncbi:MAG TPA: hypothetical protein VE826_11595 [Dongiaceae bacterium]|nr:hypothetical protein [Dongiaceae bacterium]
MHQTTRLMLATAALALASAGVASAQSSPMPTATSTPSSAPNIIQTSAPTAPPTGGMTGTPAPTTTTAPTSTPAATSTPKPAPGSGSNSQTDHGMNTPHGNQGQHKGMLKRLKIVSLPSTALRFALSHQRATADKLKAMKTIDINKLQIVRLGASSATSAGSTTQSGSGQMSGSSAGTTQSGSSNSPSGGSAVNTGTGGTVLNNSQIQYLHNVLANINVSDSLNNVTVSLSNVLNNNNISIGQLIGIYLGPGGNVTAIAK